MRIGILADIHEDIGRLSQAIEVLQQAEACDELVVLGDIFEMGKAIDETVDLLIGSGAVGVWGNHDLGFCHDPDPALIGKYSDAVNGFMTSLRPRWESGPLLFTHGLPHWDPTDPAIYYVGDRPDDDGVLRQIFAKETHEFMSVGHFHRWQIWNTKGEVEWDGQSAISLHSEERYLFSVNAVMGGWCALFDTESRRLVPIHLS